MRGPDPALHFTPPLVGEPPTSIGAEAVRFIHDLFDALDVEPARHEAELYEYVMSRSTDPGMDADWDMDARKSCTGSR